MLVSNYSSMITAIDANSLPWEERFNEKIGRALYRKNLFTDAETGMEIRLVRYPAGIVNPRHTHPCAHGMYVLEGTLVTHEGRFGAWQLRLVPGRRDDGARRCSRAGCHGVFITNKPFEIHYT